MTNENFRKFKGDLKVSESKTEGKISDILDSLEQMKDFMKEEVKKAMRRALGNLNTHIIHLAGGRPVNINELESCLQLKAGKEEMDSLVENKADKLEIQKAVDKVNQLESQLKDATVLFME